MVTRVIGIPDKDGIIRVSCNGEMLEIQVPGYQPAGGDVAGIPIKPRSVPANPSDIVGTYVTVLKKADGKLDVEQLLNDIGSMKADPGRPDPSIILFRAQEVDLHEISRWGQQIEQATSDLPLAIDFGEPGPLEK
ncbi:hypothetical protein [Mesorhizobium sp. STM 4661]|uniref:hypothetical protein n=1 Tax=Mesorhizobium sp. STM 4661 TaxID=1297570 RepID=UPI0002BEA0DA|nr:hypothetical protein [Mesorhizobium sp. STM 4661]CCV10565.1 conserved hypothetical protein [Mesorhizobium sp. STM 4661]